ncbi:PP2C family serine/threonine-protein phosphatase [Billgrantia endophytica]|uniref:PPM-type phosphatase domain-containing protein n=1 Tax=Billgrantia endophytica TaxID=2033802 RepID=A0A2N7U750_9GAMM|nr:PP2C family serine/threonine-protein phosphatase [Halomonas endophytica]PMR76258.1 hypothetical protein C1H69_07795 [Halomonas endophytica]
MPDELIHADPTCHPLNWAALAVATAGLSHLEAGPPLPCQDAAGAAAGERSVLIVADGAGSSPASDQGARAVVTAVMRLLDTLEAQVARLLDRAGGPDEENINQFARLLAKHARGVLMDLAEAQCRPVRDLRCTLLVLVTGRSYLMWLKVGDGAIVIEQAVPADPDLDNGGPGVAPLLITLGEPGRGEFANQTTFVDDRLEPDQVQSGSRPVGQMTGAAVMTDGAAEKLVSLDGGQVSGQLSHWLDGLRRGKLRQRDLVRLFYSEAFCRGTTGDDRSIALAARDLPQQALE